jgi:hypothetical protein
MTFAVEIGVRVRERVINLYLAIYISVDFVMIILLFTGISMQAVPSVVHSLFHYF